MDDSHALTPPESLVPPAPVTAVASEHALGRVPIADAERRTLDDDVQALAYDFITLPAQSDEFARRRRVLETLGDDEIQRSAALANRFTDRPTRAMGTLGEGGTVSKTLLDLRSTVEKLDPSRQGDLFSPRKFLGVLPLGNKLRDYFRGYESSQSHLNAVIESLRRAKDELLRDNAAIEQEKATMWTLMGELERRGYLVRRVGDAVEAELDAVRAADPERARVIADEILFAARQKQQDIATQLAVNVQGYMALDLIKRNNAELAKGVDRATTTTVAALRTAIVTAQALANQKLVLDQISAVRETTSNLIASTSRMLRDNATRVQEGATAPVVDVETLREAFANVRAAIDGMTDYRTKALASMTETTAALEGEVGRAKAYLETRRATEALPPPA